MTLRVLCTGDIHIGRRSSRVRDTYRSSDAWGAIVDLAISEDVDLLAVSGDIVDKESKSYEALGPLQDGLSRLNHARIETVAVTGNHDHDVLVRLSGITGTDRFRLLGAGGTWERYTLHRDGAPVLHVDGWSFPHEHVREAPIKQYPSRQDDGLPVIGLLHGDMDVLESRYAPIQSDDLWAQYVDFWLLGHIHAPAISGGPGSKKALYPGSPWALDPGEPGVHGVWMVEIASDRTVSLRQIAISPVRYHSLTIHLDDVCEEAEFQEALTGALVTLGQQAIAEHGEGTLKVVSTRIHCVGRCPAHRLVPAWIERVRQDIDLFPVGSTRIEIDKIASDVRPAVDLSSLAQGSDPVSQTARLILALDQPEPSSVYRELVYHTRQEMTAIYNLAGYASLRSEESPTDADASALIRARAWELLSVLIAQKEGI